MMSIIIITIASRNNAKTITITAAIENTGDGWLLCTGLLFILATMCHRYARHNYTASACMVQITVYLNGHAVQTCTQPPRDIDVTCFLSS